MYISRGVRLKFSYKHIVFFYLEIFLTLTNSEDPDEMWHYAAFYLDPLYLPKYPFRGFTHIKG